jgi:lysophospholipase L1-like esterase
MLIKPKSKLLMIGDSITDCGRAQPVGEAANDGLGNGYVNLVNALLSATYPAHNIQVINMGIGGNTVPDLAARWESDVLALRPDWLSVMIGINDVWRQFDTPHQTELHVPLDVYVSTLEELIEKTRPLAQGVVMLSPYFIEPDKAEPMRAMMDTYGAAMRQIAQRQRAIFVDTQAALDLLMNLASDRVHPNQVGHAALARAFLNAVEYVW